MSQLPVEELEFGASKSRRFEQNRITLHKLLSVFKKIHIDDKDAESFGISIDTYGMQIAALGIARNLIVVTNNLIEFERVPSICLEN